MKAKLRGKREKKYTVKQVTERFQEPEEDKKHNIVIEIKDTRVSESPEFPQSLSIQPSIVTEYRLSLHSRPL